MEYRHRNIWLPWMWSRSTRALCYVGWNCLLLEWSSRSWSLLASNRRHILHNIVALLFVLLYSLSWLRRAQPAASGVNTFPFFHLCCVSEASGGCWRQAMVKSVWPSLIFYHRRNIFLELIFFWSLPWTNSLQCPQISDTYFRRDSCSFCTHRLLCL